MDCRYNWAWVESEVSAAIEQWNSCACASAKTEPQLSPNEQARREEAYDEALHAVERDAKQVRRGRAERAAAQRRIVAIFPRFASIALGLEDEAVRLLTDGFLPIGTQFAQWARRFDPDLSLVDTTQACRNAWTVCGIQPLLGDPMQMTPAIIGYSLLYPYSDNYLDSERISTERKLAFSARFRDRLRERRPSGWYLWGGSGSRTFIYSPLNQVEQELGGLTTF